MRSTLHMLLGALALLCVAIFWTATLVSELLLDQAAVVAVKNGILAGMWLLIPAMAATGASGFALGRGRSGRLISAKGRRMRFIAGNGILVLIPAAFTLAWLANAGRFDALFYGIQLIELGAGALNLALLGLNIRDGLRLSGRLTGAGAAAGR